MAGRMSMLLALAWLLPGAPAQAQGTRRAPARGSANTSELARVQQEVRDLRQMLIQAMQVEQQHYDLLLKLVQTGNGEGAGPAPLGAPPSTPGSAPALRDPRPLARSAMISGTVQLKGIPAGQPVYVYIENLRLPPVHGRTLEIVQKDKQFSPQVTAVQRGTLAYFPNADRLAHNVFSVSKRASFDLGVLKSGERGTPVALGVPGVVEVYCDIHSKMWAEVLVTPNPFFAQVNDGAFRLADVPTGERVIAVWTAGSEPIRRTIQLNGGGAQVDFAVTATPRKQHNNKIGQAYSSYGE
jgi:plastocyanin